MRQRTIVAPLFIALAVSSVLVAAACSRSVNGGGAEFAPAVAPLQAASTQAGAAAIFPGAFIGKTTVRAVYDRKATFAVPNDAWTILPGTLRANFSPPLGAATSGSGAGLRLTLTYAPQLRERVLASRAPVVSVTYADGHTMRWPEPGTFDEQRDRVSVDVPAGLIERATGVTLAFGADSGKFHAEPPGPRYWNGKRWDTSGTIASGKKTVVLIHGIFSSVETAFPTPRPWQFWTACPKRIADAGKFEQVLGFDYAWNDPPDVEGALFADFLKKVVAAKVSSLSIEAHSYGSLVSLAAVPKLGSDATVANLVTMGGPLPLRGTPLAKPSNAWRMGMVMGLMAWYFNEPPSVIDHAYDSGMIASLATDSGALKTILTDIKAMSNKPHFVQVAGTHWICFIPGITGCNYSEETFKAQLVDGSGVQLPWDGVVEQQAATSTDIPDAIATPFPLSHIELQCDDGVIRWVARQLK